MRLVGRGKHYDRKESCSHLPGDFDFAFVRVVIPRFPKLFEDLDLIRIETSEPTLAPRDPCCVILPAVQPPSPFEQSAGLFSNNVDKRESIFG